jgi:hypothetical protein
MSTIEMVREKITRLSDEEAREVLACIERIERERADEDRQDIEAARKALAESDERIPYEQVRRELGLK